MKSIMTTVLVAAVVVAAVLYASILFSCDLAGQAPEKTAGETRKNVQVLKNIPESEWIESMQFVSSAVGVGCGHCHNGPYEKDDLPAKVIARKMMIMTREINETNYGGRNEVTCATCHQGILKPKAMAAMWTKDRDGGSANGAGGASAKPAADARPLPEAAQILAKYRKTVGGEGAKSVLLKGVIDIGVRGKLDIEMTLVPPDKFRQKLAFNGNVADQVFIGDHGWMISGGRVIDVPPETVRAATRSLESLAPLKFTQIDPAAHNTTRIEKLGEREYNVLESESKKRLQRLYFDAATGLLYRAYVETRSPIGNSPIEETFEDYREVNGVKMPFQFTTLSPGARLQFVFSEMTINPSIDPAAFDRPKDK